MKRYLRIRLQHHGVEMLRRAVRIIPVFGLVFTHFIPFLILSMYVLNTLFAGFYPLPCFVPPILHSKIFSSSVLYDSSWTRI